MLEIQTIRTQTEAVVKGLKARFVDDAEKVVEDILAYDENLRQAIQEADHKKHEMNQLSKSIGALYKSGKREEAEAAKGKTSTLKSEIKSLEEQQDEYKEKRYELIVSLPNIPHPTVAVGKSEHDNVEVFQNELKVEFDFEAKPHWELAKMHDLIDWDLGSKITGAGFPVYKGKGAKLQRALIAFFLDQADGQGFEEVIPPHVVNEESGFGTGQLPDKEGQMYHIQEDNLYLIPTAEVPITNLYRDVIVDEADLPIRNCGYTPCFRREAGSYGKDVRGLNRLHQFDKVEIVQIAHPDQSYEKLEEMCAYVQSLLDALELPYRKLLLCTGDTGFTSAKTFDMEVYSAGQSRWLEVSSVSNFETFQANRLKLRYRPTDGGKPRLVHTLNGSALALPRILAAILENNQQADGSIRIPKVLQAYTRFDVIG